jgi:hypothetical protein
MIMYLVALNWQQGNLQGPTHLFHEEDNHATINHKGRKAACQQDDGASFRQE